MLIRLVSIAILGAALGAHAADSPRVAQARDAIAQQKPEQAYELLAPLEAELAGDPDFDYWLGVAALDSGRHPHAVAAFERVLAVRPGMSSARLDLARTYFLLGNLNLAQSQFEQLGRENPTPQGRRVIEKFLGEIARRRGDQKRRFGAYVEVAGGHDNNISNTTKDFTAGVLSAFGIPGVEPTGNSIRRSAYFGGLLAGVDGSYPLNSQISLTADVDARGRAYRGEPAFNIRQVEARIGVQMQVDEIQLHAGPQAQLFRQRGGAPENAAGFIPRSDRDSRGGFIEARRTLTRESLILLGLQYNRLRYLTIPTQDTNQVLGSVSLLNEWGKGWASPVTALTVYASRDKALRPLNDEEPEIDVARRQAGIRAFAQITPWSSLDVQLLVGHAVRVDDKAFARADTVAIGRDRTSEADLAVVWRFAKGWAARPHVTYTRNASNIDLYTHSKTEASLALRYDLR